MKKLLGILVLGLLWCGTANAGLNEPGSKKNFKCTEAGQTGYKEAIAYLKKKPKKNAVVYAACDGRSWAYYWEKGSNLEKIHKKAYKRCTKTADGYGAGECFLFSVNHTIVWKTKMAKEIKHNEGKYVSGGSYEVYPDKPGFIKYKEQDKLTFKNPKDDIPGRFLFDQEDVTDDYQVHAIYVLAADSKDKQYDVKGIIEKIVLKGNRHMKSKTKEKQFRLDLTKEGKLDVSFLRVDKTKKQINAGDAATYFMGMAVKNGFYHPKKLYTIFYQDKYKDEWGQVADAVLYTSSGMVEINGGATYLGYVDRKTSEAWIPHLHELFHALGFVQLCASGAMNAPGSKWGKNDHLKFGGDIMSHNSGDTRNIDKKRNQYYGHSNVDCPLDLRKSAYLEPTEEDAQLQPRSPNCKLTRWQEKYNHRRSLDCMAKLDF